MNNEADLPDFTPFMIAVQGMKYVQILDWRKEHEFLRKDTIEESVKQYQEKLDGTSDEELLREDHDDSEE